VPTLAADPPVTDTPVYWFVKLERAVGDGDFEAAANAQRELARLGIRVAYGRPNSQRQEAQHAPA
jgi:hypothetical protein